MVKCINFEQITIEDRQRKTFKQPELDLLKRSIALKGLFHPIVLTADHRLVAGERRLRAMQQLNEEGLIFNCNGEEVPPFTAPFVYVSDLSVADLMEAELEENVLRVPLAMLEEVAAKAKIHQLRCEQNPKQTVADTAREIATIRNSNPESERKFLAESLIIVQHQDDPRVLRAKSRAEAFKAVLDKREKIWQGQLSKVERGTDHSHRIIHGDCLVELPNLPDKTVSTIIADPPYGIKADKQGKESNHYYDDSPEYALKICEAIIREGFRVCKTRAILFMFCDIDHFIHLRTYCTQQCWVPWRTPLTWFKGNSGHAPWGRAGFRRTTEVCLFAVKGQAELVHFGENDLLNFPRVSKNERVHAAEKPIPLLSSLIRLSTLPGEIVLDPCAGSGPIISAARRNSCRTICIERDETSYAECLARLSSPIPEESTSADEAETDAEDLLSELDDEEL